MHAPCRFEGAGEDEMTVGFVGLGRMGASMREESFSAKVIAALRNEFGGHAVKR